MCIGQLGYNFHPLFFIQSDRLVFDTAKRIMLSLQLGQHDEIHHPVLVLCKRAFGVVVFTDYFLCIGYNLFNGKLFETFVPFLQCLDGDGGGFLLVYFYIAKFGFCLSHLYIGLYPAFLLLSVQFFHLSGVFLVFLFKGLYGLFVLLRFGKLFLSRCFGGFRKTLCRNGIIQFFYLVPFLVELLKCCFVHATVIGSGYH